VNKPITRGSRRVAHVVSALSKNALADMLLDRVAAELGEGAGDERVLEHLQRWLDATQRRRGDRAVDLAGIARRLDKAEAHYLEQRAKAAESAKEGGAR
jgi:alpha-L-fucosidase